MCEGGGGGGGTYFMSSEPLVTLGLFSDSVQCHMYLRVCIKPPWVRSLVCYKRGDGR